VTAVLRPPAVLVIDDERDHALIVRELLAAAEPELTIELLSGPDPDPAELPPAIGGAPVGALVLVDRLLAGRECYPLLGRCARERPDLTLAVLSAALSPEERGRALAAGAHEAAQKPATLVEWRGLLARLLALSVTRLSAR
jgi:DNA-binding NtrC family response regulator